jgi:hypothetical protein
MKGTRKYINEFSFQRHGNLYKSEDILHDHEEVQEGLMVRYTTKGSA